jgi:RNA polymerase sigma factor (sigma-70 family)
MPFERDEDIALCRRLQKCISYILKCLDTYLYERHCQRLPIRKIGHKNILIEQVWRGRPSGTLEWIWTKALNRNEDLTLENIVTFLSEHYPQIRKKYEEFQKVAAVIMERHRGFALTLARRIAEEIYHVDEEDLIGEALLGVVSAALRYKPSRQTNFSTYAYYVVRSMLIDYISRAQKGISYSPSAYVKMKKDDSRPSILSFSEIEEEDDDGDISRTGDEAAGSLSLQQLADIEDEFAEMEIIDGVKKLPPPFSDIAFLALNGEIEGYKDLRRWGIPTVLAAKLWDILERLIKEHVLLT